jgi:hypothetical protein
LIIKLFLGVNDEEGTIVGGIVTSVGLAQYLKTMVKKTVAR